MSDEWSIKIFKSGCLQISTRGRKKMKFLEKSPKNYVDYPRYSTNEDKNFSFIG